ncbi:hypothetical protein Tco_0695130, partial [Tanacetum coccineum]
ACRRTNVVAPHRRRAYKPIKTYLICQPKTLTSSCTTVDRTHLSYIILERDSPSRVGEVKYVGRNVRPRFVTDCTHNDVAASIEEVLPTEEMNPAEVHCEVEQERWLEFCLVVTEKQKEESGPYKGTSLLFSSHQTRQGTEGNGTLGSCAVYIGTYLRNIPSMAEGLNLSKKSDLAIASQCRSLASGAYKLVKKDKSSSYKEQVLDVAYCILEHALCLDTYIAFVT